MQCSSTGDCESTPSPLKEWLPDAPTIEVEYRGGVVVEPGRKECRVHAMETHGWR